MNRVKEGLDVSLENYIRSAFPRHTMQLPERIVSAAIRTKTKRTIQKILLLDSAQYLR
jgi:hypothetical protein